MKMKSFAMLAVSGLLAASLAALAPAYADDATMASPSDSSMQNNGSTDNNTLSSADTSNTGSTNDQGTPDTATGDDDY